MAKQKERETIPVSTRVSKPMYTAILKVLEVNAHINVADYVRDVIRVDLERKGVLSYEEIQKEPAK